MVPAQIERLYQRRRFGIKPGLEVERALLDALGHPEADGRYIHVAGTNGKGSVCAMLASVLQAAGYRVGLYTSPHLVRFNERFMVNGVPISDDALGGLVAQIERVADRVAREVGQEPTFFECATAMALEYFRRQRVDVVVLETGLGGRLDATNTVRPVLSVITRIGLEHTVYLGDTLEAVAGEKAGIIKPGVPVVAGDMPVAALGVMRSTAQGVGSPLVAVVEHATVEFVARDEQGQVVRASTRRTRYGELRLSLAGAYQVENLATVVTAIDELRERAGLDLAADAVRRGLAAVTWSGRFQLFRRCPPLVLDAAHNPDASRALAKALAAVVAGRPIGFVVGLCDDKDIERVLDPLVSVAACLWAVPLSDARGLPPGRVAAAGRAAGLACTEADLADALRQARSWATDAEGLVCVTGSFFLVGQVQAEEASLLAAW